MDDASHLQNMHLTALSVSFSGINIFKCLCSKLTEEKRVNLALPLAYFVLISREQSWMDPQHGPLCTQCALRKALTPQLQYISQQIPVHDSNLWSSSGILLRSASAQHPCFLTITGEKTPMGSQEPYLWNYMASIKGPLVAPLLVRVIHTYIHTTHIIHTWTVCFLSGFHRLYTFTKRVRKVSVKSWTFHFLWTSTILHSSSLGKGEQIRLSISDRHLQRDQIPSYQALRAGTEKCSSVRHGPS